MATLASGSPLALTAAVRAQLRTIDPDLPLYVPTTLRQAVDESLWGYRVFGPLLVVIGAASLFLATVGLYSLMSFAMRQRTGEIGLRIALGARATDVARLVAGQVTIEVAVGLAVGAPSAPGWRRRRGPCCSTSSPATRSPTRRSSRP